MKDYCKTCCHDDGGIGFCDKCYYNHIFEEKGIPPTEYEAKPKPQTNADRLRAMSDEELADWLVMNGNGEDYKTWLDWLRQEATNDP